MAIPGLIVGSQALQQDENSQFTNRHLAQIIAERAAMLERDRLHNEWLNRGRAAGAGQLFGPGAAPQTAPVAAPFAGPMAPPTGMATGGLSVTEAMGAMGQPPAPGQASVPMQPGPPPMGALGGMSAPDMPPGAPQGAVPVDPSLAAGPSEPQAAPQPAGWQPSPAAGPELGGAGVAPTASESASGLEPAPPSVPKGMTTLALISGLQKRTDLSPEDKLAAVEYLHPIVKAQEQEALTAFKQENEILKVGIAAMRAESDRLRAQTGATVGGARVTRMQEGAATAAAAEARKREELDARLSGRLPTGRARAAGAAGTAGAGTAGGLTDEGINLAAEEFRRTGKLPSMSRDPIERRKIINRAAEQQAEVGDTAADTVTNRMDLKAVQGAYTAVTKDLAAIGPYNNMLETNGEILKGLARKAIATSARLANRPINWLRQNATDNPDVATFLSQARIFQTEAARVLNNPRLVGQLTDSARHEMEGVVNGDMPPDAMIGVIDRLTADGRIRVGSMEDQAAFLRDRLAGKKGAPSPAARPASGAPPATSGPKRIANQAEFDALPKGATFIGPDGKARVKP